MIGWLSSQRAQKCCSLRASAWSAKLVALLLLSFSIPVFAQDLASFEKNVTVKTLPNGLTVVL